MREKLEQIKCSAQTELNDITTAEQLEALRVRLLGKKGELTAVLRGMGQLSAEERPEIGQRANEIRLFIEEQIEEKKKSLRAAALDARLSRERIDVTMPGKRRPYGNRHPIAKTEAEMCDIFRSMGFDIAEGPEI